MNEKILILNEFEKNEVPYDYFFDLDGKVCIGPECIRNKEHIIALDEIFCVSPIIEHISNVTILLCQKINESKSVAVSCMKNAKIYKNDFNKNWLFGCYNIICDAKDAYFISEDKREYYFHMGKYKLDTSYSTKKYIEKISQKEKCVKFDCRIIDKKIEKSKTYKELVDISVELDNAHQYSKTLEMWEREYSKDKNNPDVIFQLAISNMDCNRNEKARYLFEKIFDYKKNNDFYLSRLAVLYFIEYYSTEAKNVADMIKDRGYLEDWGYSYEYISSYAPVHVNVDSIMGNEIIKHKVNLGFMDMQLPLVIENKSGTKRYFDPIRKKGIPATKEETVRQKVLRYLLDVLKIPEEAIKSEDHMAHYDKNATTRADITVRTGDSTLLIVECKEPSVVIDGEPVRQLFGYNDIMHSKYLLLTNGNDSYIFQKNSKGKYDSVMQLPDYKDMLSGNYISVAQIKKSKLKRPSIQEMKSKEVIKQYRDDGIYLGINTPERLAPFILNLMWSFLDIEYKVENISGYGIKIEKDNETVDMKLTNASGGSFPGRYRQFIVKDRKGDDVIVSFAVLGNYALSKTKGGYTSLVCGVDRTSMSIARLELRLDVSLNVGFFSTYLFHNGIRSRKKCQTTIDYVGSICRSLIKDNKINLGTFPNNKLINTKDKNVQDFLLRLISYVLLRDEMSQLNL